MEIGCISHAFQINHTQLVFDANFESVSCYPVLIIVVVVVDPIKKYAFIPAIIKRMRISM